MAGVLAVAGSVCRAQKVDFGVLAGLVFSHPSDYNTRTGFSVGAKGIYTFRDNSSSWFVEAQAKLASKGWKYDIATYDEGGNLIYYSDWTCNAYYLEIPVYAGYKFKVNDDCGIFIEAGPYLAAGLFGNSDVKGGEHNYEYYSNVFADGFYKRFDWGAWRKRRCGIPARAGFVRPASQPYEPAQSDTGNDAQAQRPFMDADSDIHHIRHIYDIEEGAPSAWDAAPSLYAVYSL